MLGNMLTGWCDNQLNILPVPQKIEMGEGTFLVKKGLTIVSSDAKDFSANFLKDKLEPLFDFPINLSRQSVNDGYISFVTDKSLPEEGYRLDVSTKGITIASADEAGKYYGVQTLLQLFPSEVYSGERLRLKEFPMEVVTVEDAPRFKRINNG